MRGWWIALALVLAGCGGAEPEVRLSAQGQGGRLSYANPLVAQAKKDFFGEPGGGGGGSGGSGGIDEQVRLTGYVPAALGLKATWPGPEAGGWQVRPALGLTRQVAHLDLPQGLGILTDPMQIDIGANGVTAELALHRHQAVRNGWAARYDLAIGVQRLFAQGHIRSALIDLQSDIVVTSPFASAGAELLAPSGTGLAAEVIYLAPNSAEWRLGLVQRF